MPSAPTRATAIRPAERLGYDFFAYKPFHMAKSPPRPVLAKITNEVQAILSSGKYDGAIWTQGSPQVEETAYWFNLLIDTDLPIACNAAQRPQGQISNDGPANIVDSVTYIESGIWKDGKGGNRAGTVVIQEQQFFAAARSRQGRCPPRRLCRHRRPWRHPRPGHAHGHPAT